jgi:spoIIIJ-associated protein
MNGDTTVKKEVTITAKTTELALEEAAKQLGAPSVEALEYEIVEKEKKGFLGLGSTPAVVHVSYRQGGVEIAREFIERLLADMKIEATLTLVDVENADKQINIDGKDVGALIGHHGETLDSLQYLVNLAANQKTEGEKREFVKITIDIEGYRAKREEALRSLARRMADRVIKYKKSVMLEPMNPYERRIIHSEVQNIKGVSTNSIGSENNRKVVIYLEDKE